MRENLFVKTNPQKIGYSRPVADSMASPTQASANINHTQRATASARNNDGDRSAEGHNREGG